MTTYSERLGRSLLTGASDPDGDPITVRRINGLVIDWGANGGVLILSLPNGAVRITEAGAVTLDDATATTGSFPADGETSSNGSFTYTLTDGSLDSATVTATITLRGAAAAANVPAAFTAGQWSVADAQAAAGGTVTVTVSALPDDGGSDLIRLGYRINGGTWVTLTNSPATGTFDIEGLTPGTAVTVQIRAVNAVGVSLPGDEKSVTPTSGTTTGGGSTGATITGGTMAATVNLSGITPAGGTTEVEWRVCPSWGDVTTPVWPSTPQTGGVTGRVAVAALATPASVPWIAVPGTYVVFTREIAGSTAGAWSTASAPATVTAPAAVTAKSWYADVAGMTGPNALGVTVGRTSAAALTTIDGATMTQAQVAALLPAGWTYATTNGANRISPPSGRTAANPAVFENYLLRNVRFTINGGDDHVHIRQNLIYPASLGENAVCLIFRGGRLREFASNTVIGPRAYGGTGQVVQCQYAQSAGQGRGIVDTIARNFVTGMSGDCFSTTGSPITRSGGDPDGTWVHHNVLDAVGYASNFPGTTGDVGNWFDTANAPHGDLITVKGSYDLGTVIEDNVFWQIPVEPLSIPAGVSHDGVAKVAGAARPFAGSRGNPLGNAGHTSQNNACRVVQDNSQLVDAALWAGPVRITRFLQPRWAGMAGLPFDHSSQAQAAGDIATWDGIAGASDPGQSYAQLNFTNTTRTTLDAYFLDNPTYTAGLVNFWTGATVAGTGATGDLATPLEG